MILPAFYYRRAWLRSFWVSLCLVTLLLMTGVLLLMKSSAALKPLWLTGGFTLLVGLVFPPVARLPYACWRFGARYVSRFTCATLALVCYFGVLLPISFLNRSRFVALRGSWGDWSDRRGLDRVEWRSNLPGRRAHLASDVPPLTDPWEIALVPFIWLLRLFAADVETRPRTDTYTLY